MLLLLLAAVSVRAQQGPGFALHFDGSSNYVAVPHTAGLNPFPLTVMAWVQTIQNAGYQGLVNKYAVTSFNGWNLFLRNGRVRAWYFVSGSRFVWDGGDGLDGGFVADGLWHHVAFVVDSTGASLYVDGVNRASRGWTGAFGGTTSTQELRLGNFPGGGVAFNGLLDDITLWQSALTQSQVQSNMTASLTGTEPNLLLYFRCDEGSGSTVGDSAPLNGNNHGTWVGTPLFEELRLSVETLPASAVSPTQATLNGLANPNRTSASAWFEWGTTTNYDNVTPPRALGSGNGPTNFSEVLTGAFGGVTHFRAVASNSAGVVFGANQSFAAGVFSEVSISGLRGLHFGAFAWGDYDNDGRLDFVLSGTKTNVPPFVRVLDVWHNTGSTFTNFSLLLPPDTDDLGLIPAWGDFDNDNRLDLLLSPGLLHNRGSTFTNLFPDLPFGGPSAWSDFDNDGKADIVVLGNGVDAVGPSVFRNIAARFFVPFANLPQCRFGSVACGDYDQDGRLDILLVTDRDFSTPVWRNSGGGFTNINLGLPAVRVGAAAWGDYDNDGRLDILLAGSTTNETDSVVSEVWRNTGSGFTNINAGLPRLGGAAWLAWGDYDNDGRLDILLTGLTTNVATAGGICDIWRNTGNGFTNINAGLPGVMGPAAWGDYDNDGRLDIVLTGGTQASSQGILSSFISQVWRNHTPLANTPPTAPTGLSVATVGNEVIFSWNPASDAQTPASGLTYNLRVGTAPGGTDLVGPMAASSGFRRLPQFGNAQHNLSWRIAGLPVAQILYWSVQAVDTAFAGSAFAPEEIFTQRTVLTPTNGVPVPGDINGDGVVNENELNTVLSNYFPNSPFLQITNVAGLGGTNVTFALTNSLAGAFSVESTTNLLDWLFLGPATPRYEFTDTNAPTDAQRYYRLRWP